MRLAAFVQAALVSLALACGPAAPEVVTPKPQTTASAKPPVADGVPDEPLPLDARITKGKLPNGLTYYVLPHKKPEQRAQLWLAVNAGSVLEDDDQRGLAHFVEHMAFNGTKRFPKQEIVDFLEKSRHGVRRRRQRVHVVRRDHLHAASPDRRTRARERDRRAPRLGRRRHVRSGRGRQGARRRARRVAARPRRGDAPLDKQAPVLFHGLEVRRADHDRKTRDHQGRAARHARAVLQGLVSARAHGGHRGRRFRSGRDRSEDQRRVRLAQTVVAAGARTRARADAAARPGRS